MQYLIDDATDVPLTQYQQNDFQPPQQYHQQPQFQPTTSTQYNRTLWSRWQQLLDQSSIYTRSRWGFFAFLSLLFSYRIIHLGGFYIIAYGLALFELNLLIGFLSPLNERELDDSIIPDSTTTSRNDEFKPFMRRLPEFQFWYACTNATLVGLLLTLFSIFDIPVFWPILLLYFIILFVFTMKKQIQHMVRYKYLPFSTGKQRYQPQQNPGLRVI